MSGARPVLPTPTPFQDAESLDEQCDNADRWVHKCVTHVPAAPALVKYPGQSLPAKAGVSKYQAWPHYALVIERRSRG